LIKGKTAPMSESASITCCSSRVSCSSRVRCAFRSAARLRFCCGPARHQLAADRIADDPAVFNVGVEIGRLLFVAMLLAEIRVLRPLLVMALRS